MDTFEKRKALVFKLMSDPDLQITVKEAVKYVYHWYKYETALQAKLRAEKDLRKYGRKLNDDMDVFEFRKEMRDL